LTNVTVAQQALFSFGKRIP